MALHNTSDTVPGSHLGRLNDLDDYKVADGFPDPRGWDVKTTDGQTVGKVGDLIVDTQQMRVRYVDVELERSVGELARDAATPGDQERHTLLPIGSVELDDAHDDVRVSGYTLEQIAGLPRYGGQTISRDYERSLVDRHRTRGVGATVAGAAAAAGAAVSHGAEKVKDAVTGDRHADAHGSAHDYDHDDYDDQRLYAARRARMQAGATQTGAVGTAGTQGEQRITLAEEQLRVGKRQTEAGEVALRKTVDTQHVREQVELRHDEVTVERRPVTDPSTVSGRAELGADEIRVPIMEERVVMQKVLVPREEIIVRKNAVVENQTVEADLRHERLDTTELEQQQRNLTGHAAPHTSGAVDRATDSGLLDRTADKLDDLKDRVDGNPASRPGPDATDRRI
jgi:uncharacterized protein (TIGR02271 family)